MFIPTYLYIKEHSVTGMLYFGKTIKHPETYLGSGKYWLNHINKYGKEHVVTLWYCLFLDEASAKQFALMFSTKNNIVESKNWANLAIENGTNGGPRTNTYFKIYNSLPRSDSWKKQNIERQKGKANKQYPVKINEVIYPSITAAGKAYNLTDAAIHYWIKKGKAIRLPLLKS